MQIRWTKATGDVWSARVGPFSLKVHPKGDGRWAWQVFKEQTVDPTATGVASSLGAARSVSQQFVMRSGLV